MPVTNRQISKLFSLGASLLELHEDNSFKSKAYDSAAFNVRQIDRPLATMTEAELETLPGIGKNLSKKIVQISKTGSYEELDRLLELTPPGLIELIGIKGLGGKKVKTLWQSLAVTSPEQLLEACEDNLLVDVKGFGKKTQDNIIELIHFYFENKNSFFYAEAEAEWNNILEHLEDHQSVKRIAVTGEVRRKMPVVAQIEVLVQLEPGQNLEDLLSELDQVIKMNEEGYRTAEMNIPVYFYEVYDDEDWIEQLMRTTGSLKHIAMLNEETLDHAGSEEDIYAKNNLPYIIPEMREGKGELEYMKTANPGQIISIEHIAGCIHNHSNYSDGNNTLAEMANYCKGMGLQYFGISDHSQIAVYANGLKPNRVLAQMKEIDKLNAEMAPFRIFKGIESDILGDGSLDYEDDILEKFDFVVASVHSNLTMKEADANKRLLKAIENPYTTIIGHMTGRLLLTRAGFPINHEMIIDACVANDVVIEINANPKRLDMDWQWYDYALNKGALFSINPDAHSTGELHNMYYGVCVARKGGIPPERVINTWGVAEIEAWFKHKTIAGL